MLARLSYIERNLIRHVIRLILARISSWPGARLTALFGSRGVWSGEEGGGEGRGGRATDRLCCDMAAMHACTVTESFGFAELC